MESNDSNTEKMSYSASELQEFKTLILKKLAEAERDLVLLREAVAGDGNEATDTAPTFKTFEEGSNVISKELNQQLANRTQRYISDLKMALIRIENKTYGISRISGKLIPKERLMAVPHATTTIEEKLGRK